MKRILILIFVSLLGISVFAQNVQEVVYLKNGSIIKGVIMEQVPGVSLKVQTSDGSIFAYKMEEVEKITKEVATKSYGLSGQNMINLGYKGFFDMGYVLDLSDYDAGRFELTTTHGCQFSPYLYVGAGVGIDYYTDASMFAVPIFANIRASFVNQNIAPFFDVKIGYSLIDVEGLYFTPSIGCRFATGSKNGVSVSIGYVMQRADVGYYGYYSYYSENVNMSGLSLKIGFDF